MTDFRKRSGCFTSDGTDYYLRGISPFFKLEVFNVTQAEAEASGQGFKFVYYRGMNDGSGIVYTKGAASGGGPEAMLAPSPGPVNVSTLEGNGFTVINTGENSLGPEIEISAISTAEPPVATNSGKNALTAGSTVIFTNVEGAPQIAGIPFTVGNNTLSDTTFSIDYLPKLGAAGTKAKARILYIGQNNNAKTFYITKIEKGQQTKVQFSTTHNMKKGDRGTFMILDDVFGMPEANQLSGCVVDVDTEEKKGNTVTLDIDSRNFSDFTFPDNSNLKFTPAQFIPAGVCSTGNAQCCLCKKGNDIAMAVVLKAGKGSPAGQKGDKIYWEMTGSEISCWGKK